MNGWANKVRKYSIVIGPNLKIGKWSYVDKFETRFNTFDVVRNVQ
jgi:hypothetical protein